MAEVVLLELRMKNRWDRFLVVSRNNPTSRWRTTSIYRNANGKAPMIAEVFNSYALTLEYLRRLVADVPGEDLARQPNGVANHPAWVIGHLVYSCEAIGGELGLAAWLQDDWSRRFGTGSIPIADRTAYPSKEELLLALSDAETRVSNRLVALGDAGMSAVLPDVRYRETFPTIGHAVVHILTGHAAVHVGQVSVWRRAAGYPMLSEAAI
jgi:hypothetical protein